MYNEFRNFSLFLLLLYSTLTSVDRIKNGETLYITNAYRPILLHKVDYCVSVVALGPSRHLHYTYILHSQSLMQLRNIIAYSLVDSI